MSTAMEKVAIAGPTGNLGPAILSAVLSAGFQVTALIRETSKYSAFPDGVSVVRVDYTSLESLTNALKGHDALVSTLTTPTDNTQNYLIDAAIAAGVKRIIPSEFGSATTNPKTSQLPCFAGKVKTQQYLVEKSEENPEVSYTLIITGPFLDWGLMIPFILDLKGRKADLFDGGDRKTSATTLKGIGQAVVGVLNHPKETANRAVHVASAVTTQNELIAMAKKAIGGGDVQFETKVVETKQLLADAEAERKKGPEEMNKMLMVYNFIKVSIWGGEEYGQPFAQLDNELLGVETLNQDELEKIVALYV